MTRPARPGRIILINGTSSSGKTTLVRGLQSSLPALWLEMGIDRFAYALPGRVLGQPTWPQLFRYVRQDGTSAGPFTIMTTVLGQRFISGMHATVAVLAEGGLNVIVDHVLLEQAWLEECARIDGASRWQAMLYIVIPVAIPGMPPNPAHLPSGCAFAPRCPQVFNTCREAIPELLPVATMHYARCALLESEAPQLTSARRSA